MPKLRYPGRRSPKKKQREALSCEKPVDEAPTCVESPTNEAPLLRRSKRNRQHPVEEESETLEAVSGDDCVVGDDSEGGDDVFEEEMVEFDEEVGDEAREQGDVSDDDSGDDIWEEEKFPEPLSHSDDEGDDEIDGGENVVENEEPEEIIRLGKTFNSPEDFKLAVLKYSLKARYNIRFYRSQSDKIGAKCLPGCSWRCYCSYNKRKTKMQIRILENEHTCVKSGYSKMLKISNIVWLFRDRLLKNPKMTKKEMVEEVNREYNMRVSEDQCAKVKTLVMRESKAIHEDHFARIWDYQAEIFRSNPGSSFEIETVPGPSIGSLPRFHRLFICFKSQRDTWKQSCRPIIGIDGAFLKWDVKGHLLAATGRDGDNRIVPIAWAVVEIENDDNWEWFLRQLAVALDLQGGRTVAMITDKQWGLVKAIKKVTPDAEHRLCARHILENWRRKSHDMELQRLFWKIARSYTVGEYNFHMRALQSYNPGAYASLLKQNPEQWSRAFFRIGTCCNDILNNLSESFNRTIRLARKKPLLDMLEEIRRQCMVRNERRYLIASRLKDKCRFTKKAHAEIEKTIAGAQFCVRYGARNNVHEIMHGDDCFEVNMDERTCGCRKWQMTGIPCVHAASVIIGTKQKVEDFVADWYTALIWQQTYIDGIRPVQGPLMWPAVNRVGVLPPPSKRSNPGRPSNYARRRGVNETASSSTRLSHNNKVITCSNCQQEGHNKNGCKNQRVEPQPKKPRGRPRKVQEPRRSLFGQRVNQPQEVASQQRPTAPQVSSSQPSRRPTSVQAPQVSSSQPSRRPTSVQAPQVSSSQPSQRLTNDQASRGLSAWFNCSS